MCCACISAAGIDLTFVFNSAGSRAVTIADILKPNGLHIILGQFAHMFQSGNNVFINDNTCLFVYTFTPPSGGVKCFYTVNKVEFLKKCQCEVHIINSESMICFSKVFVLGLAHVCANRLTYLNCKTHNKRGVKRWDELAVTLHRDLGLDL